MSELDDVMEGLEGGPLPPVKQKPTPPRGKNKNGGAAKQLELLLDVQAVTGSETLAPAKAVHEGPVEQELCALEERFKEVVGLAGNLRTFPITAENHLQVKTDKSKSEKHGEVFTPLWLVDEMIERVSRRDIKDQELTTRDLCCGYGQFTVRLMRCKYEALGESFDLRGFLEDTHTFVELQPNSCYRLLSIFGKGIRLCMGDATKLGELPDEALEGIWVWCESKARWSDMTAKVLKRFEAIEGGKKHGKNSIAEKAERFETEFEILKLRESRRR